MKTLSVLFFASLTASLGCGDDSTTGGGGSGGTGAQSQGGGGTSSNGGENPGGASQGGSSQGGEAQGGTGQGGAGVAQAECTGPADCQLVNDCCTCEAIPTGETPADCAIENCFVPTCEGTGHDTTTVDCQVGRCVAAYNCDHASVTCDAPTPACPEGQTASVNAEIGCWGPCVRADECSNVSDCGQCGDGQVCVEVGGGNPATHCVVIDDECNGVATCACMGQSLCGNVDCAETNGSLVCQVP